MNDAERLAKMTVIVREWAQHDSWRCDHPDRYPQDEDCQCGLLAHLRDAGIDPEPWRRTCLKDALSFQIVPEQRK